MSVSLKFEQKKPQTSKPLIRRLLPVAYIAALIWEMSKITRIAPHMP